MPITKIRSGQEYKTGAAIVGVDKLGNFDRLDRGETTQIANDIAAETGILHVRFDDYTYYSA